MRIKIMKVQTRWANNLLIAGDIASVLKKEVVYKHPYFYIKGGNASDIGRLQRAEVIAEEVPRRWWEKLLGL